MNEKSCGVWHWHVFDKSQLGSTIVNRAFSLEGDTGEQQSAPRPVDCARRRNGTGRGAMWSSCPGGV